MSTPQPVGFIVCLFSERLTFADDDGIVVVERYAIRSHHHRVARRKQARASQMETRVAPQTIETRVESLEQRVTRLEELPVRMDRLESQIVQLRTEMHDEFSAVRREMATRMEVREEFAAVRREMGELTTRREIRVEFAAVRQEIRNGDEETRHYMRMLFEEYIGRMKAIDEGEDRRT